MKHFNLLILLALPYFGIAQENVTLSPPIKAIVLNKIDNIFKVGDTVSLTSLATLNVGGSKLLSFTYLDLKGYQHSFDYKLLKNLDILPANSIEQKWQQVLLRNGVYENLAKNDMQYDFRNELNDDAISFVSKLKNENKIFNDPYFEDYLYTLSNKIHPGVLKDGRPGNIYILIIKDTNPNAFALPNGTIVFSTGLLSTIQSEDELIGVLAHEISHFVLDHHVINYNKMVERKKRAEFWSGLATVVSAGADIYLSSKYSEYIPGMLTASTAILSTVISNEIVERLGIKYNREQEFEADKVAAEIIDYIKGNKVGLSAALMRLKNFNILSGNYASLYDSRTHPNIDARIKAIGKVDDWDKYKQPEYFKKSSIINSYNAWIELWIYAKHTNAIDLANRNILSNVGTESDYIVKAVAMRRLYDTKESNEEVIALLEKGKSINVIPNKVIPREEAITLLRLNKKNEAKIAFQTYLTILFDTYKESTGVYAGELAEEIEWTKTMIYKIDNL